MTTTQEHLGALDSDAVVHQDALAVLSRLVEHARNSSTDLAPAQWSEPVAGYCDPDLWAREIAAVHRSVPLPLALSCELPDPGSYKSMDVAGTPVLLTRADRGDVRAVINVCRHRGAELVPAGVGWRSDSSAPTTPGATTCPDGSSVSSTKPPSGRWTALRWA